MADDEYRDSDGNLCSLYHLCRTEPEWSASVIRELKRKLGMAEAHIRVLQDSVDILREKLPPSVVCGALGYQACQFCDDLSCGDNASDATKERRNV